MKLKGCYLCLKSASQGTAQWIASELIWPFLYIDLVLVDVLHY